MSDEVKKVEHGLLCPCKRCDLTNEIAVAESNIIGLDKRLQEMHPVGWDAAYRQAGCLDRIYRWEKYLARLRKKLDAMVEKES